MSSPDNPHLADLPAEEPLYGSLPRNVTGEQVKKALVCPSHPRRRLPISQFRIAT